MGFLRNVSQLRPLSLSAQVAVGAQKSFQHPGLSIIGFRVWRQRAMQDLDVVPYGGNAVFYTGGVRFDVGSVKC